MSEDRILETLGQLTGLVQASREDIKNLCGKQDKQVENVEKITTAIAVIQTNCASQRNNCSKHFEDFDAKLGRDYTRLNTLEEKGKIANGIEKYKGKTRAWWQYTLGIIVTIIAILTGINQLMGISEKFSKVSITPAARSHAMENVWNMPDSSNKDSIYMRTK